MTQISLAKNRRVFDYTLGIDNLIGYILKTHVYIMIVDTDDGGNNLIKRTYSRSGCQVTDIIKNKNQLEQALLKLKEEEVFGKDLDKHYEHGIKLAKKWSKIVFVRQEIHPWLKGEPFHI